MLGKKSNVQIVELFLIQTGTYQDQHLRPFQVNADASFIDQLSQNTHGGTVVNSRTIEGVASELIKPTTNTSGVSNIPGGWASRRFSFLMKVVENDPITTSSQITRLFYGYTDGVGVASNGALSPSMRMYFSSETTVVTNWCKQPNGAMIPRSNVLGSTQIINPIDMASAPGGTSFRDTAWLLRPEDTFRFGGNRLMNQILEQSGAVPGSISSTIDQRSVSMKGVPYQMNRRLDNSPSRYLTNSFNGYLSAAKEQKSEQDDSDSRYSINNGIDQDRLFMDAASMVSAGQLHQISFFDHITRHCGYLERGYVEYNQLVGEFDNVREVTQVSMDNGNSIRRLSHVQDSTPWNLNNTLGQAVSTISQTVPSIMMECCLASVRFAVTPGHGYGNFNIVIETDGTKTMFDNLNDRDVLGFIEEFKRRLTVDVLNAITHGNQQYLSLGMSTHLLSESVIDIHFADYEQTRFVAPTFSDSLFPPVATLQEGHRNQVASDLLWIMGQAFDDTVTGIGSSPQHAAVSQPAHQYNQPNAQYSPGTYHQQPATHNPSGFDSEFTGLL